MARLIVTAIFFFLTASATAAPRLYVFDCGTLNLTDADIAQFNLSVDETAVRQLFVPCYLIEHAKGLLLWDGGLPLSVAEAGEPVPVGAGSMIYERSVVEQLADMGLKPADIDFAAYSHLHFDHAGVANIFVESQVLMQQAEWDGAFGAGQAYVDTSLFEGLKEAELTMLNGDHDVFGDGSVQIILAPGHTPGHQVLLVNLENTGPVLLSGDLYHFHENRTLRRPPHFNHDAEMTLAAMTRIESVLTETNATLWIEHDKALADSLKKAPAYYD